MEIFTRRDIFDALKAKGKEEKIGLTLIITLRKNDLGYFKMARTTTKNPHTKEPIEMMGSLLYFNVSECISHFQDKITVANNSPFRIPNPSWIKAWELAISRLEIIREYEKDVK